MLKQSLTITCVLIFVLSLPQSARSCVCEDSDAQGAFRAANVVFVGKVIKIDHAKEASVGLAFRVSRTPGGEFKLKAPRWETSVGGTQIVTLEVTEAFKGASEKTIQIRTARYDHGASCGVNFHQGESYLVYAYNREPLLSTEQAKLPKKEWTTEIQLKSNADKFNQRLPLLGTGICCRTEHLCWAKDDAEVIRGLLKTGRRSVNGRYHEPVRVIQ